MKAFHVDGLLVLDGGGGLGWKHFCGVRGGHFFGVGAGLLVEG